jgi:hypothetical protein
MKPRSKMSPEKVAARTLAMKVARTITANPEWSDEQIANQCQVDVSLVLTRREILAKNQRNKSISEGIEDDERECRPGKRVDHSWLRIHCSRWERNVRNIQTLHAVVGIELTLAEIRVSCREAGLSIDKFGAVGMPGREPETDTDVYQRQSGVSHRRIKIGRSR